jgi:uncharacterized OB-fold protein
MDLTAALDFPSTLDRARYDRASGHLVGSRCDNCNAGSWPSRAICHRCGRAAMRETPLSVKGSLVTYTRVWVSRPGLDAPFTMGQVHLPEGIVVFAHVQDLPEEARVPMDVLLRMASEETSVPPFFFVPAA